MTDFLLRAAMAGGMVAVIAGPLGCFVIWRRMAFFGDTLSHAALLGVAISLLTGVDPVIGIAATGIAVALALSPLSLRGAVTSDTMLALISHTTLAVGIIAVSARDDLRLDLMSYLFGDILAVTPQDLWIIGGACVLAAAVLAVVWRNLLLITVNEDMARAEGITPYPVKLALLVTLALLVATAVKVVGLLLITAMLIIPAAAARALTGSPETMAGVASAVGLLSVAGGLAVSFQLDTPTGPTIVAAAAGVCAAAFVAQSLRRNIL